MSLLMLNGFLKQKAEKYTSALRVSTNYGALDNPMPKVILFNQKRSACNKLGITSLICVILI